MIQPAVRRGELPRGTPALSHVLFVPGAEPDDAELRRHARRLVDLVLAAYR